MPTIKYFFLVVSLIAIVSCHNVQPGNNKAAAEQQKGKMYVEVQPFKSDNGWGYNIYVDKKLYISQGIIPGVAGTKGFRTKEDAMKVGILAVQKMSVIKGRPTITTTDLEKLQIATN